MSEDKIQPGSHLIGTGNVRIGIVDAVFADYLLVRTRGLMPIDLYVPRSQVRMGTDHLYVAGSPADAYARWHRPLKRAPHD